MSINDKQDSLVDAIGNLSASLGINRVAGQLYGLLFLSNEPLSLDYMVEKLKISKGSVSTNIRELEKWSAVKKVWIKGSRKDYYIANTDTLKVVINRIKLGLRRRLTEFMERINEIDKVCKNSNSDEKALKVKLKQIKNIYSKIDILLNIIPDNLVENYLPKILKIFK